MEWESQPEADLILIGCLSVPASLLEEWIGYIVLPGPNSFPSPSPVSSYLG